MRGACTSPRLTCADTEAHALDHTPPCLRAGALGTIAAATQRARAMWAIVRHLDEPYSHQPPRVRPVCPCVLPRCGSCCGGWSTLARPSRTL